VAPFQNHHRRIAIVLSIKSKVTRVVTVLFSSFSSLSCMSGEDIGKLSLPPTERGISETQNPESSSFGSTSALLQEGRIIGPSQEDESLEAESTSSSLSPSPTIESQGLLLLQQALTMASSSTSLNTTEVTMPDGTKYKSMPRHEELIGSLNSPKSALRIGGN
jgi:hypothetical protein